MKNIFKKALSFFLAVIMTVGMFPVSVFATEAQSEEAEKEVVYISVSHDDKFIKTANESFAAHIPVLLEELEAINLDNYGLTEFKYNDKITVLHLLIYAHETIFGKDWGDIYITGASGSIYFESGLFGFEDSNFKYWVNGREYISPTVDAGNFETIATADQIVLKDGDFIFLSHYTDYNFLWDTLHGFNYFFDSEENVVFEDTTEAGDYTVNLKRISQFWDYSDNYGKASYSNVPVPDDTAIYYGKTFYGSDCETSYVAGEGSAVLNLSEAGTWYIWADGQEGEYCGYCSSPAYMKVVVKGEESAECDHQWSEATCELPKTCSKCGKTEGEAKGHKDENKDYYCDVCEEDLCTKHTEETVEGKDATCTETGLTEGKKCSVCQRILVAQTEIPSTGHKDENKDYYCDVCKEDLCTEHIEETVKGKDATCTETGLTEGKKCSVCQRILVAQTEIPENGHEDEDNDYKCDVCKENLCTNHSEVVDEAKAPTCTETGLTAGKHCGICKEVLLKQEVLPAKGHSRKAVVTPPTCTEAGYTTSTCETCGDSIVTEHVPATGHKDEDKDYYCDVCEDDLCTEHTEETVAGKDATCTETGLTEGKKCSVCQRILVAQTEIPEKGHKWGDWVRTKEPTTAEEGIKERSCENGCGEKETKAIGKLEEETDIVVDIEVPGAKPEEEHRVLVKDSVKVPENLPDEVKDKFSTTENIEKELEEAIFSGEDFKKENSEVEFVEITLQVKTDEGWKKVDNNNFPSEGLEVVIPYPAGSSSKNAFEVAHLKEDGTIEILAHTETEEGLLVKVNSLSPFAVAYKNPAYLSALSFHYPKDNIDYQLYPEFSEDVFEYTIYVPDSMAGVEAKATLSEYAPAGSLITTTYKSSLNANADMNKTIPSGASSATKLNNILKSGQAAGRSITIKVGTGEDIQDYILNIVRTPTLGGLSVVDRTGTTVKISGKFDSQTTEYTATTASDKIVISAKPKVADVGYVVTYNGSEDNTVYLAEGENNIEIKVKNAEDLEKTYNLNVTRTSGNKVSFNVSPSNATVFVSDENKNRVWPYENGEFGMATGAEYTYNVTANGYIGKTEKITVNGDAVITVNLEKAPETPFTEFESSWPSFGLNDENNIVIDRPTPRTKDETALYWATKVVEVSNIGGESSYNNNPVGVPILINDYLYTYAKNKLFKIDKMSGEILEMGTMTGGTSTFAICSLAYGEGLIFVGLNGGTVQAFNAETLESVWVYRDSLGGQPNGQLTYNDGYLYTGFWNGESKTANYSCISVTDEDPENTKETKLATWSHTQMGGFYWAGAYVDEDYLYIGTDDGSAEGTSTNTHLLSIDKRTGKVVDDVALPGGGDIRCSVTCYEGKLYFTSKGGYFYEAEFDAKTGDIGEIRYLKLENGTDFAPMSTSTPTIYNGRAYIGVSGMGQFVPYSGHNITVIDLASWSIAYSVATQGYPQTTGTLTTYYEKTDGYVYVYFFDNMAPGKLRVLADKPGLTEPLMTIEETSNGVTYTVAASVFEPADKMAQYCICTPIIDKDGTLYFKNDSGHLFAVGSAVEYIEVTKNPDKMSYKPGEIFDPKGMEITAYYMNGTERDITDYVTYSTEPLENSDKNFMIVYENVGSDEKPYAVIELSINGGVIELVPEKEPTKTKIRLNDTVKFDNTIDTPETFFADKPAGGVFYVGIISDMEYDKLELHTTGYLKGQLIDFDPEKYRSIGETYCVYNKATGEIAPNESRIDGLARKMTYDKAAKLAKELNDKNEVTYYEVKCEQFVYVAKITVPENYGVSYNSGTYKITAEKDGIKYASAENKIVTDVSIFEYEYLKWAAENGAVAVLGEDARGYSSYLSDKYGYGRKYDPDFEGNIAKKDMPTVVSTTGFRAVSGEKMVLSCGEGVKITIPEISKMQRGVNFIYKNTVGELDSDKKTTVYSLNFFGKQPIQSDFVIEWKLGVSAYELRESFKIKVEEEDIITYYILKDGKYFDEFTVDYMTDDIYKDIILTFENEGGTTLGKYSITTKRPADADSAMDNSEEFNPNTGAPIF